MFTAIRRASSFVSNLAAERLPDTDSFLRYGRLWITGKFMNRLLILGILIISTAPPLFAQAQQPNAAELAQKVVSIISGDKAKTQTYCQILDLSDELDQADQQKDREKAEELSQKINELQKNLAPNTSRCSKPLSTWIQIPKTVRRSCRTSLSSIIPAGNGDVLIRGLTSAYSDDPAAWASTVAK